MIRVNLLPPRKKKALVQGQRHLLLIVVILVLECLLLAWWYRERNQDLLKLDKANAEAKAEVARLKEAIGDLDKLKKEQQELERQQKILDGLEKARGGPVKVLDELAFLLSPATSEKARSVLLRRDLSTTWDPRRISLSSFVEKDRVVQIAGVAKTNDDVAEFMKRLESSAHFQHVQLNFTKSGTHQALEAPFVTFDISCQISYTGGADSSVPKLSSKRRGGHHG